MVPDISSKIKLGRTLRVSHYTKSSSFQMALVFTLLCGMALIVLGYFSYYFQKDSFIDSTEALIDTEIKYLSKLPKDLQPINTPANGRIYLQISPGAPLPEAIPGNIEILTEGIIVFRHKYTAKRYAAKIHTFPDESRLLIGVDITTLSRDYDFMLWLSIISIVLIILIISMSYFLSIFVVRGTSKIALDAQNIVKTGDLSRRLEVSSRWDDLGRMTVVLNEMLERIEELMRGVKTVSDNIAHDLRTPLTRIRNTLETIQSSEDLCADKKHALDQVLDEADQLLSTFSALLRISRIESEKQRKQFVTLHLHVLIDDLVEYYEPLAAEKDITLTVTHEELEFFGDRDLLFQALANILDNAIKYTPKSGHVDIKLYRNKFGCVIELRDNGPGISDKETGKIFNRFYRTEKSRNTEGVGLGLSLVSAVVELHKGRVKAENMEQGLKVTMELPL